MRHERTPEELEPQARLARARTEREGEEVARGFTRLCTWRQVVKENRVLDLKDRSLETLRETWVLHIQSAGDRKARAQGQRQKTARARAARL